MPRAHTRKNIVWPTAGDGRDDKAIRVLGDEAHTRKNIEKMLEYENKSGQTTVRPDGCFEIVFQA